MAASRFGARIARLVRDQIYALRISLFPATETDAEIVEQQLDIIRRGVHILDFALPVAGAVLAFSGLMHGSFAVLVWWIVLSIICAANEFSLRRQRQACGDIILGARKHALSMAVMSSIQIVVWSTLAFWVWQPGPEHRLNHMFVEFIFANTLAVVSTMLAFHAATVAGPIVLLSLILVVGPGVNFTQNYVVAGVAAVYVVLIVSQAAAIHNRTRHMLRMQKERGAMIRKLRNAKAESDEARRRAVEASRAKSAFLANMSHELRTPLNAIIGFSDIIRNNTYGEGNGKYGEYGGFIHQSGHRLLDLISDILDLAKIEAGRKILQPEPIDLSGVGQDAVEEAQGSADEKHITVSYTADRNLPLLSGDLRAVRQIFDNLLSNAVKFTSEGGHIHVSVAVTPQDELTLTVADDGIGIPDDEQPHIFDRFGRTEPQVRAFNHGVGLGLPIVKGLVDMHGGLIVLKSALGEGTSVSVTFPAASTLHIAGRRVA